MINAGILREIITVVKLSGSTVDAYGENIDLWINYISLRAGVKFAGGSKTIENFENYNSKTLIFTTYIRKIDESMRIIYKGDTYIINSMPVIEYDYMLISAEKLKNK